MYRDIYDSPLGRITLYASDKGLYGLYLPGQNDPHTGEDIPVNQAVFTPVRVWLNTYFQGKDPGEITFPLDMQGTPFQKKVWQILREIPYGKTMTYGEIAKKISPGMSAQAVGNAVSRNPVSVIVPCHRVLGSQGRLTGYQGGLELKKYLLDLEGITCWK